MPDVMDLFEDYASAYARGERPQAREFLTRAGTDADELATMIDRFLAAAPARAADEAAVTIVDAWSKREPRCSPCAQVVASESMTSSTRSSTRRTSRRASARK